MNQAAAGGLQRSEALLEASGMALAWPGSPCWRVLELLEAQPEFSALTGFLACWQRWRLCLSQKNSAATRLHYALVVSSQTLLERVDPLGRQELLREIPDHPSHTRLALELSQALAQSLPSDSHRSFEKDRSSNPKAAADVEFLHLSFDGGRVMLTLCLGPAKQVLREHAFVADSVLINGVVGVTAALDWDRWTVNALAALCQHGTTLTATMQKTTLLTLLQQRGFQEKRPAECGLDQTKYGTLAVWHSRFEPSWQGRRTRRSTPESGPMQAHRLPPGHCAVVGAGLAGASMAAALAARGWRVTVLDAAKTNASGASGVPLGLLCPQESRDNSPRSRLSRAGVRLCLHTLRANPITKLREGVDWAATGVLERCLDRAFQPPEPADKALTWADQPAIWHANAAWVRPQALIQAWLASPGVEWVGGHNVGAVRRTAAIWQLLDDQGHCLTQADIVVVAAAGASPTLIESASPGRPGLKTLQAIPGQVSFGAQDDLDHLVLPPHPLNGHGHLAAQIPLAAGKAWYAGSTYELDSGHEGGSPCASIDAQVMRAHAANAKRMRMLLQNMPQAAAAIARKFENDDVQHWRGTRYTLPDRLPVCGPLGPIADNDHQPPSLWVCCALGSRGLSWAALCAELVAAQISGEPLPLPRSLARLLGSHRLALRPVTANVQGVG